MAKNVNRGPVELVALFPDKFHEDTVNAQVRQPITTVYETQRGPFVTGDSQPFNSMRYCFVPVPKEWTEEQVAEAIKDGSVRRTFGCIPESVMSEGQRARIASLPAHEAQELRDRILNSIIAVDGNTGEELTFQGYPSFGRNEFVLGHQDDIDLRAEDVAALETMDLEPVFKADKDPALQIAE